MKQKSKSSIQENHRLMRWVNWLQDEAVVNFDDSRVGLFRRIKEGLTVEEFIKEKGNKKCHIQNKKIENQ